MAENTGYVNWLPGNVERFSHTFIWIVGLQTAKVVNLLNLSLVNGYL